MDGGGCVLVLMTEGGELKQNTNINFLLEEFGIMVNNGELLQHAVNTVTVDNCIFCGLQM